MADANCPVKNIDSNSTGLAYAEEACPGILPGEQGYAGTPVWRALEPNSYDDFGGEITTTARNPINASRQNKKGVVTDLEASGGFTQDLTLDNTTRLLQDFFFADQRAKPSTAKFNGAPTLVTAVDGTAGYSVAGAATLGFKAGHIVMAEGFNSAANNGVKVLSAASGTAVVAAGLAAEAAPPAWAALHVVGFEFGAGQAALVAPAGDLPRLTITGGQDLTQLGLIPGEWVFIGGDNATNRFSNNVGFARIKSVSSSLLIFDKVDFAAVAEAGSGKSIRLFFGDVIKNESDPALIKPRSIQLRRTLGRDADGVQSEYILGAFANELTLNLPSADKLTVDLAYVALTNDLRTGAQGLKPGTEVAIKPADAFNSTSDFSRIKLAKLDPVNGNPQPLFAFASEMTLTISNGVTMNKALGVLGAFSQSTGNFAVGGDITAYFADVTAVKAVRDNADVTLDIIMVKKNAGMIWDIPLMTLGGGRVQVEQDSPIMLPLENNAAESAFGHTLLFQSFRYLPTVAMA